MASSLEVIPTNWWAGQTVDHLYENCPNRLKAEKSLRFYGLWDLHNSDFLDPLGDFICGMCQHRYKRKNK